MGNSQLQVGSEAYQTIDVKVGSFNPANLGGSAGDIVGEAATGLGSLTGLDGDDLVINDTAITTLTAATTLNEALDTINADLDGKGAEASSLVELIAGSAGTGVLRAGSDSLELTLVDGDGNSQSYEITGTDSMDELVEAINNETAIEASVDTDGKLVLNAEGATSITVDATLTTAEEDATGFADGRLCSILRGSL